MIIVIPLSSITFFGWYLHEYMARGGRLNEIVGVSQAGQQQWVLYERNCLKYVCECVEFISNGSFGVVLILWVL